MSKILWISAVLVVCFSFSFANLKSSRMTEISVAEIASFQVGKMDSEPPVCENPGIIVGTPVPVCNSAASGGQCAQVFNKHDEKDCCAQLGIVNVGACTQVYSGVSSGWQPINEVGWHLTPNNCASTTSDNCSCDPVDRRCNVSQVPHFCGTWNSADPGC